MARANLGQLLGNPNAVSPPTVTAESPRPVDPPAPPAVQVGPESPRVDRSAKAAPPPTDPGSGATYLRFVRKDTRLREDQLEALTSHARRLNRKRRSASPRVTENTLIRVAVDLLLDRIDNATGDDEATLLRSVRR